MKSEGFSFLVPKLVFCTFVLLCLVSIAGCEKNKEGGQEDSKLSDHELASILNEPPYEGYIFKYREFDSSEDLASLTYDMRVAAAQIPEDSLAVLTSEGLAWSNLFCFLNGDYRAYGGLQTTEIDGVDIITDLTNGWRKQAMGRDGAAYILKIWGEMDVPEDGGLSFPLFSLDTKHICSFNNQGFMPLLLSLEKFNWSLPGEGFKVMADIAYDKILKQASLPKTYSYNSIKYNYVALATAVLHLAELNEDEKRELEYFIDMSGGVQSPDYYIALIGSKLEPLFKK